jgi:putative flippase GtrA
MKNFINNFAEKHPKAAQWIREGGLFLVFSYVVTFFKYLLLTFLPGFYEGLVGSVEWTWPGINVELFGVPFTLAIIGNSLADGGLAFTLANYTSIFLGECINFPCQRNVTFRSHGPLAPQIACHLLATIAVMLVMNLFTCVWNPVTAAFGVPDFVRNIVTTVATGGVSMVIIFAVDKTIFAPGFGEPKGAAEAQAEK